MQTASKVQAQAVRSDGLLERVRDVVRKQPYPPRRVATADVARAIYGAKRNSLYVIAVLLACLFVITFFQAGSEAAAWGLRLFYVTAALFYLAVPAWEGVNVSRWTRAGLTATADVLDVTIVKDRYGSKGSKRATGRRIVHHPQLGDFEDEFSLVAPWASSVTAQSKLDVLVAPDGKKTWLTLAVNHSTSPTEDRLPDAATGSVNQRTIGGLRT